MSRSSLRYVACALSRYLSNHRTSLILLMTVAAGLFLPQAQRARVRVKEAMNGSSVYPSGLPVMTQPDGTILIVNSITDSGDGVCDSNECTLREAIATANNSPGVYTIQFAAGLSGTIELDSALQHLDTNITLKGPGAQTLTVRRKNSAATDFPIFFVGQGRTVNISGLTISGGTGRDEGGDNVFAAGGIYNDGGTLSITDCTITDNHTSGPNGFGGGIYNRRGTLALTNSTVSNNSAISGGGIRNQGVMTVNNSTISNNSAGLGGGIRSVGGSLTVIGSTISYNTTSEEQGGGGIRNSHGGQVTIINSLITNNTAPFNLGPPPYGNGGGIYSENTFRFIDSKLTIIGSTISSNSANTGGGLYINGGTVSLTNSTVSNNSADTGGAIYGGFHLPITNCTITQNSTLFNNSLQAGYWDIKNSIIAHQISGGNIQADNGQLNDLGNNITSGDPQLGLLRYNGGPTPTRALLPGSPAINAGDDCVTQATHCGIQGLPQLATDQRGAPRKAGAHVDIGAFESGANVLTVTTTEDTSDGVCDAHCSLREAIAQAASGDTIVFSPLFSSPQLITLAGSELTVEKSLTINGPGANLLTISGNNQSRIFLIQDPSSAGIRVNLSGMNLTNGKGLSGVANGLGGAIYNNLQTLEVTKCTINGNDGPFRGGGIYSQGGALTIVDSTISNNTASGTNQFLGSAAGLQSQGSTLAVINSTISGNAAPNGTGGIIVFNGTGTIINTTITNNAGCPSCVGGAMSISTVRVRNTIIAGNQSNQTTPDVAGSFISDGNNLIGNVGSASGFTDNVNGDQVGGNGLQILNPVLAPLADNGGPTLTHALLLGSPAINGGNNCVTEDAHCGDDQTPQLGTDQRGTGFPRLFGAKVDIGAYESPLPIVTSTADSGAGSLRESINTATPGSTIIFNIPANDPNCAAGVCTISLTNGQLLIDKDLTISGLGANRLIVKRLPNAPTNFSVFHIAPGVTASISGLTISGGVGTPNNNSELFGGGVLNNRAFLTIINCTISQNQATYGGGIFSLGDDTNAASLTIINSTISDNTSPSFGGGIGNQDATLNVINTTISGNKTSGDSTAAGIDTTSVARNATANLTNSTITANDASGGTESAGGIGSYGDQAVINLRNTIVAGNTYAGNISPQAVSARGGVIVSRGNNLCSDSSCGLTQLTDKPNTNPLLGSLANNGGPTLTYALLSGSPALDAGDDCVTDATHCDDSSLTQLTTDQRGAGFPRKLGAHVDIGAFELASSVSVSVPANQVAEATSSAGAVVNFTSNPSAVDLNNNPLTVTCDHTSGSTFSLGTTTVQCSATDSGHTGTNSFTVTVRDTTPPTLTLPGNLSAVAPNSSGVAVQFSPAPSATDLVSGTVAVTCTPAPGSIFPVGTTTVQCSATDAANNTAQGSFDVTVTLGNTSVGSNVTIQPVDPTTNSTPVTLTFQQVTTPGNTTVTSGSTNPSGQPLPANFKLGSPATFFDISTTASFTPPVKVCVSYSGVAYHNESNIKLLHFNAATQQWDDITTPPVDTVNKIVCGSSPLLSSFVLTEADQPPVITVPTDKTVEATSANGAVVTYTATATDDFDSSVTVNCSPLSGSTFSLGTTTVQCSATDSAGNNAVQKSFKVKVQDTTAPVISLNSANLNPMTVEAKTSFTDPGATAVDAVSGTFAATASGTVNTNVVGNYTITYRAKDAANNAATPVTRTVKVVDTTLPTISCLSPITVDAASPLGAVVTYPLPSASDRVSAVTINCLKPSGSAFAVGTTTVQCTAKDASQNAAYCSFNVTVLGSQGIEADVLNGLKTLRQATKDKEDGHKLDEAIGNLTNASDATLWIDPLHLAAKRGDKVFNETRDAIEKLRQLLKDKKSTIQDAVLQSFIDRLLQAERLLAQAAINDAAATPRADAKKIAEATKELSKAEAEAIRGNYNPAIDHYREAWKQALMAIGKL